MKVKELINHLKQLDQDKEIGLMDDNCELNIEGINYGEFAYTLTGSYDNELDNPSGSKWKELK